MHSNEALDKERQLYDIKNRFYPWLPMSSVLRTVLFFLLLLFIKKFQNRRAGKRNRHMINKRFSKTPDHLLEDFLSLGKLDEGKVGTAWLDMNLMDTMQDTIDEMKDLVIGDQQIIYIHMGNLLSG